MHVAYMHVAYIHTFGKMINNVIFSSTTTTVQEQSPLWCASIILGIYNQIYKIYQKYMQGHVQNNNRNIQLKARVISQHNNYVITMYIYNKVHQKHVQSNLSKYFKLYMHTHCPS